MTARIRPKARDDLAVVELDGEAVIYDEGTGDLHHLNPTATIVFSLCDGTATIREIADDLAEAFTRSPAEVEPQVRRLLLRLRRAGLLQDDGRARANGRRAHANERDRVRQRKPGGS